MLIREPSVAVTTSNILPPKRLRRNRLFLKLTNTVSGLVTVSTVRFLEI